MVSDGSLASSYSLPICLSLVFSLPINMSVSGLLETGDSEIERPKQPEKQISGWVYRGEIQGSFDNMWVAGGFYNVGGQRF